MHLVNVMMVRTDCRITVVFSSVEFTQVYDKMQTSQYGDPNYMELGSQPYTVIHGGLQIPAGGTDNPGGAA